MGIDLFILAEREVEVIDRSSALSIREPDADADADIRHGTEREAEFSSGGALHLQRDVQE